MPAVTSSWLVGSAASGGTFVFNSDEVMIPLGEYYLRHPSPISGLGLLDLLQAAINAAPSPTTCTSVEVLQNRHVRINLSAPASISWGVDANAGLRLANLLGFDGSDLSGAASYEASRTSPLLFSAGYPAKPKTIPGVEGYTKLKQIFGKINNGRGTARIQMPEEREIWQELSWAHIVPSRLQTLGSTHVQGGTFHQFFQQSLSLGAKLFHYENMVEDAASTTPATWSTPHGPYELRNEMDGDWYVRNVENADISSPLKIPLLRVSEYGELGTRKMAYADGT